MTHREASHGWMTRGRTGPGRLDHHFALSRYFLLPPKFIRFLSNAALPCIPKKVCSSPPAITNNHDNPHVLTPDNTAKMLIPKADRKMIHEVIHHHVPTTPEPRHSKLPRLPLDDQYRT